MFDKILANFSPREIEAISNLGVETKRHIEVLSPPPSTLNHAEFIALRVIVQALIAEGAVKYEASGAGSAQKWINDISVRCQDSLLAAEISGEVAERLRREVIDHINLILGRVRPPNETKR